MSSFVVFSGVFGKASPWRLRRRGRKAGLTSQTRPGNPFGDARAYDNIVYAGFSYNLQYPLSMICCVSECFCSSPLEKGTNMGNKIVVRLGFPFVAQELYG